MKVASFVISLWWPSLLFMGSAKAQVPARPSFSLGACGGDWSLWHVMDFAPKIALEGGFLVDVLPTTNFSITVTRILTGCAPSLASEHSLPLLLGYGTSAGRIHSDTEDIPPVIAVSGCVCSGASLVTSTFATSLKVPMVSGASTSPSLSNKALHPYFARTIPPDNLQVRAWLGIIKYFGWTRVALIEIQQEFSMALASAFLEVVIEGL